MPYPISTRTNEGNNNSIVANINIGTINSQGNPSNISFKTNTGYNLNNSNINRNIIGHTHHIHDRIMNISNIDSDVQMEHLDGHQADGTLYKVELDSHANMPVVGMGAYIISDTGSTADVNSYNPTNGTL